MKIGRQLGKVKRVLSRLGLDHDAIYVEHASMPNQKIFQMREISKKKRDLFLSSFSQKIYPMTLNFANDK